jgi:hypothetical protein
MSLFGLFSSHIPYIIIGVMYMLYLGGNLLSRYKPAEESLPASGNTINAHTEILHKNSADIDYEVALHFTDSPDIFAENPENPENTSIYSLPPNNKPYLLICCHKFIISFFSRPPPAPSVFS